MNCGEMVENVQLYVFQQGFLKYACKTTNQTEGVGNPKTKSIQAMTSASFTKRMNL